MIRRAVIINNNRQADIELPAINSANIFCALETKKKPGKKNKKGTREQQNHHQQEPVQAWTPKPISVVRSWADYEDDEDDVFALPVLPPLPPQQPQQDELSQAEENEEDEQESDEEIEEQQETEANEAAGSDASSVVTTAHEPDKQLSKKELKRRELAQLDAVLAELGLNHQYETDSRKESNDDDSQVGINKDLTGEVENAGSGASPTETKNSKRRKTKKDKLPEEERDEELPLHTNALSRPDTSTEEDAEFNMVPSDPKVVMKWLVSKKKKKSSKDGAVKAAVAEASARAAKLAASKKKEKSHYNQRPAR